MRNAKRDPYILWMKKSISINVALFPEFAKFSVVGIINTLVHYFTFLLLYTVFRLHYLVASAIGYCIGMITSFIFNKFWTFRSTSKVVADELFKFVFVNLGALLLNLCVLNILVNCFSSKPEYGQIVAVIFSTVANFLGNKFWTFRKIEVSSGE